MADPVIMAANERIKSLSRTIMQLGGALVAAATVNIYAAGRATLETGGWLVFAIALIWLAWKMLMFLESES